MSVYSKYCGFADWMSALDYVVVQKTRKEHAYHHRDERLTLLPCVNNIRASMERSWTRKRWAFCRKKKFWRLRAIPSLSRIGRHLGVATESAHARSRRRNWAFRLAVLGQGIANKTICAIWEIFHIHCSFKNYFRLNKPYRYCLRSLSPNIYMNLHITALSRPNFVRSPRMLTITS